MALRAMNGSGRPESLEQKLARRSFVVTAEMPVIDGGGMADVHRHLEPMAPYVDAFNATDNPGRARPLLARWRSPSG